MLSPTLYQFFRRHLQHAFGERGLAEPATVDYVSEVLTRFAYTPELYAVKDTDGIPLEHIAQFMLELRRAQGDDDRAADSPRQALITRHVGEYSLFMSGLFRERLAARGQLNYYLDHGRSAYWQTADFEPNPRLSQVFRRLYFNLEKISGALDHMRRVQFPLDAATHAAAPAQALWRM